MLTEEPHEEDATEIEKVREFRPGARPWSDGSKCRGLHALCCKEFGASSVRFSGSTNRPDPADLAPTYSKNLFPRSYEHNSSGRVVRDSRNARSQDLGTYQSLPLESLTDKPPME